MNKTSPFLLLLCLALPISGVRAEQKIFTGKDGPDWAREGNWQPPGIPTAADDVLIQDADVMIGAQTEAVAASVTVAGGVGALRILSLAGPGSVLTTGGVTLGSDSAESKSVLLFKSTGTLHAAGIVMAPGEGESRLCLRAAATLDIGKGKGAITRAEGKGSAILEIDGEAGALGLLTCDISNLVIGQSNTAGTLEVAEGQTYTVDEIRLGNGEPGENGTGTLAIKGGTVKVGTLLLNAGKNGVANNSVLRLDSGRLVAQKILRKFDGASQIFDWNGGTIANREDAGIALGIGPEATQDLVIRLAGSGLHAFETGDGWQAQIQQTAVLADRSGEHGTFTKTGPGTLEIRSTCTYTGATAVNAGELLLTGEGTVNSSSGVTVARSAKFTSQSTVALPKKMGWLKK